MCSLPAGRSIDRMSGLPPSLVLESAWSTAALGAQMTPRWLNQWAAAVQVGEGCAAWFKPHDYRPFPLPPPPSLVNKLPRALASQPMDCSCVGGRQIHCSFGGANSALVDLPDHCNCSGWPARAHIHTSRAAADWAPTSN